MSNPGCNMIFRGVGAAGHGTFMEVTSKAHTTALLKMWSDDCTNHRSLQHCDWSRCRFSATVTLKSPFLQLCNHVLPPVLLCKQCEHVSKVTSTSWSNLLPGSVH